MLTVIVPCYNEAENLVALTQRLLKTLDSLPTESQIFFVNDGSTDQSLAIIKELAAQNNRIKYISLSRNFGQQVAFSAGINNSASSHATVLIDADLQDPPELIAELYQKWQEGYHVAYAQRTQRQGENGLKKITAYYFNRFLGKITNVPIPLDTGDYKIIDKKVADVLRLMPEQQKYLRGQVAWAGFRQTPVFYERNQRLAGSTHYTYRKMLRLAFDGITGFSNLPLKMATILGFWVSLASFFGIIYALYARFVSKNYVPGWTSLIIAVFFMGGVQLICLGIIGEYLGRLSENVRNRPLYVIAETNLPIE